MNRKIADYVAQSLAASGFAVLEGAWAYLLRRDIFVTAGNARGDFSEAASKLEGFALDLGATLYRATIKGQADPIRVAARSSDRLADRLSWVLGVSVREVVGVRTFAAPTEGAPVARPVPPDVPAWPCNERAEYFRARGEVDPNLRRNGGGK